MGKYIKEKLGCESDKPVSFVFHGGSGSSKEDIQYAIKAGVIKMNIDSDTQWAFWDGVNQYQKKNWTTCRRRSATPRAPRSRTRSTTTLAWPCVRARSPWQRGWWRPCR